MGSKGALAQQSLESSKGSASGSLNVVEVVAALVALHGQLTRPPLLHLGAGGGLVIDGVHLAHDGLDAGAAWHTTRAKSGAFRAECLRRGNCFTSRILTRGDLILLRKKKSLYWSTGCDLLASALVLYY